MRLFTWIKSSRLRNWGGLAIGLLLFTGGLYFLPSKTYLGIPLLVVAVFVPVFFMSRK